LKDVRRSRPALTARDYLRLPEGLVFCDWLACKRADLDLAQPHRIFIKRRRAAAGTGRGARQIAADLPNLTERGKDLQSNARTELRDAILRLDLATQQVGQLIRLIRTRLRESCSKTVFAPSEDCFNSPEKGPCTWQTLRFGLP
jgi:hypothetical protein